MGGEAVSMRSIDVRNVIAKSKEIEGIQRAQNRVATTGQQAFEAELSKQAEEKSSKVQSPPETQHEKIRHDDKGQGGGAEKGGEDGRMSPKDAVGRRDTDDDSPGDLSVLPGQIIDVEV
jgi:hypothetical protein